MKIKHFFVLCLFIENLYFKAESEAFVRVTIEDSNDNAPKFEQNLYILEIGENRRFGTFVGVVQAMDIDEPESKNSRVTYSIDSSYNIDRYFWIDENSGIIWTRQPLDAEKVS